LRERLPYATVFTHLEPAEDPRSFADTTLDRAEGAATLDGSDSEGNLRARPSK
jgi:hypothetical protein